MPHRVVFSMHQMVLPILYMALGLYDVKPGHTRRGVTALKTVGDEPYGIDIGKRVKVCK